MPLPLPNLDTRRWADLVDEGRALIPRYAPAWTDHNIHDPGITLIELFAWLVEQDIYRLNRVPERHRRKFLALAGFTPQPPRPAQTSLSFTLQPGVTSQNIPVGLTVATGGLRFRTAAPLTVVPALIQVVQVFNGTVFSDETRRWRDGLPFPLLGTNPVATAVAAAQPAFYVGFNEALPIGIPVTLWFRFSGPRHDLMERLRIQALALATADFCQPLRPLTTCTPVPPPADNWCPPDENEVQAEMPPPAFPAHHTIHLLWEYYDGTGWQTLDSAAGQVLDDSYGFTLNGAVQLAVPGAMVAQAVGVIGEPAWYVRARLIAGPPDAAPLLADVSLNTVTATQTTPARSTFPIAAGVMPPLGQEPVPGTQQNLHLVLDTNGIITALAAGTAVNGPEVFVLAYQPEEALTVTLMVAGVGTGLPGQQIILRDAPIAAGRVQLWTSNAANMEVWRSRTDLDASQATDADYQLEAMAGVVTFGDGQNGRVVPSGTLILAAYEATQGGTGNIIAQANWQLAGADDALNQSLLGGTLTELVDALAAVSNRTPAAGGSAAEAVAHAAGRAAETLWAHERLLQLCTTNQSNSLDQLDQTAVLSLMAPNRATTLIDFERLALDVPGTQVSRAKAWAGLDPTYPGLKAPGTVTVVIVPALPQSRPIPTPGLLQSVWHTLNRQRVIGTRLVVVGPQYLVVSVRAVVRTRPRTNLARVQVDILAGLNAFLDPLTGGPNGRGWPFGRDVYRAEILQVIDNVAGVDHVLSLELVAGDEEAQCGNLCVGPTWLVTPGTHLLQVE